MATFWFVFLCHNFIRDSVIYADDFRNYKDDFPKDFDDEYGIGVFHDYIAVMLLSWLFLVQNV
jgi:hypothetical protein